MEEKMQNAKRVLEEFFQGKRGAGNNFGVGTEMSLTFGKQGF